MGGKGLSPVPPGQLPASSEQGLILPGLPSPCFHSASPCFTALRRYTWAAEGSRLPRSLRANVPHVFHARSWHRPPSSCSGLRICVSSLRLPPGAGPGARTVGTVQDFASLWWSRKDSDLGLDSLGLKPHLLFWKTSKRKHSWDSSNKQKAIQWTSGKSPPFSDVGFLVCEMGITAQSHGFVMRSCEGPMPRPKKWYLLLVLFSADLDGLKGLSGGGS